MTEAIVPGPVEELIRSFGPADQQAVSRAIDILEDDDTREAQRVDLALEEDGLKLWGFQVGSVWFAFAEIGNDSVLVVHVSLLSRFRYPRTE